MKALTKVCARLPTPRAAWIHQIHAAGGVGGSTTMDHGGGVCCVFVCCCGWTQDVTSSLYVKWYERITLR